MLNVAVTYIQGPVGQLEALVNPPPAVGQPVVIICHPHPLYGGTMHNKVVTTLARAFSELDMGTVRFNYRGVGQSVGSYGEGIGETEDGIAIFNWVKQQFPASPVWVAGFSFGCYVAAGLAAKYPDIKQLVTIAPAVNHADFTGFTSVQCPWLLIMGDADEIVPVADVQAWVAHFPLPIKTYYLPGVSHFFHGQLGLLRETVQKALRG
ncbi:MAG: alpha/beta fold hydrolase [Gammaproteobacteria bacterium]